MNGSVAKKTQETLGKVIKKPPLTEKLLSKPPFRYLHDIVSEVIRTTGFMKGLYGEAEMKSDNVKDKDSKIAFLQKAIDVVMLVSGEPVAAKPARIVAGHEPEKTNELLQTIAKCCLNKLSSDEAVRHVLAGDKVDLKGKASTSRSQGKENREEKIKESSVNTEQKDPDQPKDQESRRRSEKERHRDGERTEKARERDRTKDRDRDKDKSRDRDKEKVRDRDRDKEKDQDRDNEKDRDRERDQEKEKPRDRDRDRTKDREREKNRERDSHKDRERVRDKDRDHERDKRRDRDKERERERARELQKETEEKKKDKAEKKTRAAEEVNKQKPHPEELNRNHKAESGETERDDLDEVPEANDDEPSEASPHQPDSPARIPRPSSAKGQRRRPKSGAPDESDSDGGDNATVDKPVHLENGDASDALAQHTSHSSSSRRIARPSSARPAPPRVRRQESYTDAGPVERLASAKPPSAVIMDGKKHSEDEDDEDGQFVVEEAGPLPLDMPELEMGPSIELQGDEKHGGLVKKILETKKDYESSPSALKSKDQDRTPVLEAARKKEREFVVREIERLRTSVQSVCRSALPLGKIMDYIQEDMDSMQNELQSWRRENREHAEALLQEQRITDSAVKPLKAELSELEQLIMEQQDKICAIKSNILQNEEKIRKMVSSINVSQT
ncbi:TRAF3-interacting protein 1 isoform X2 [Pangasianodon hypophthalmus]|uniref:TRAF3-interacting protein 1 isoform X2 n=1 Tax=Pangasianodon hypophthalmus TaxID=310915 RepID=UPI00230763D7|nr:TRAF3-interacting protein 1 isoform X2 [Pangasianodon hypophthalmus]